MAPQTVPKYSHVTSTANPVIINLLETKYQRKNVVWPIVLIKNEKIICLHIREEIIKILPTF